MASQATIPVDPGNPRQLTREHMNRVASLLNALFYSGQVSQKDAGKFAIVVDASVLVGTALAASIVDSSLTEVGILTSLTATLLNKVTVTPPATQATLTLADHSTLQTVGAYAITLTATGTTNVTLPTSGTLAVVGLPQNSQSADYTIAASDNGGHIYHPAADTTARTWTIDSNANLALPVGFETTFVNDEGAGVVTVKITSDTLVLAGAGESPSCLLAATGHALALKVAATRWIIDGTGLSLPVPALVASTVAGTGANGGTTSAINTTGASLLVLYCSYALGVSITISDSKGNAWTPLTVDSNGISGQFFYCLAPTVGSGHTFSVSGSSCFAGLAVYALAGLTSFISKVGATSASATSLQPGSITPLVANAVLVTGLGYVSTGASIDSGFTAQSVDLVGGSSFGIGGAYLIETAPTAENPTWSIGGAAAQMIAAMALFAP